MTAAPRRPGRGWWAALIGLTGVALVAAMVVLLRRNGGPAPSCQATAARGSYRLDLDQAANATTIAAVGKQLVLPDHAVTIALAAALQESKLRNLDHGDLDSLGLFQQRPSQGWGTPSQILTPSHAAASFYRRLVLVTGWQTLSVTDAAQQVQKSGAPDAYAQWETEARVLAQALTGEVAAGFACRLRVPGGTPPAGPLTQAMATELGIAGLGAPLPAAQGWTVASWLVGHAGPYRLHSVAFSGRTWTAASGVWRPGAAVDSLVRVRPAVAGSALASRPDCRGTRPTPDCPATWQLQG